MVALTPRFTLLAALTSLVAVPCLDAAAVPVQHLARRFPSPKQAVLAAAPVLPLPMKMKSAKMDGKSTTRSGKGRFSRKESLNYTPERGTSSMARRNNRFMLRRSDRARVRRDDHDHDHDHDDDHDHDHDHHDGHRDPKVVVSGNDDTVTVNPRSPLVLTDNHGVAYHVSRSNEPDNQARVNQHGRRDEEMQGMLGLYLQNATSDAKQLLANLTYDQENFAVLASQAPATLWTLQLHQSDPTTMPVGKISTGDGSCVTYNPCPGKEQLVKMAPCVNVPTPLSQTFMVDMASGTVQPMGVDSCPNVTVPSNNITNAAANSLDETTQNFTGTGFSSRDISASPQNVTLVFVPSSQTDSDSDADVNSSSSVLTTTSTVTTTSTIMTTVTNMAVAMDVTANPSATATGVSVDPSSQSQLPTSSSSTTDLEPTSTANSDTQEPTSGPLDVEVVPLGASSASPTPSTSTSDLDTASSTPSPSVNAEDIASSIAASWTDTTTASVPTSSDSSDPNSESTDTATSTASTSTALYQRYFRRETRL